jgi:para-nitrobenzyl esterase
MSVGTLLGCPAARGLFHKAIPQSGSCQAIHDHESAATVTTAILSGLGMATPNVKELREVPAERLMQVQQAVSMQLMLTGGSSLLPFQPVVDGALLPRHPMDEIRDGIAKDVRVMVGTTRDEWKLFGFLDPQVRQLDEEKIALRIQKSLPHADGAKIVAGYRAQRPESDWASIWLAIETDRIFRIPSIRMAEAQLTHQPDVYSYLFTWESPGFGGLLGACHAIEIPFVFSCLDLPGGENFVGKGPDADRLAGQTMDAWLAFAKSGDPSHSGIGTWSRYDTQRRATMELGPQTGLVDDPAAAERALWDGVI